MKTEKIKSILKKLFIPVTGLAALIWFLIRVIPKPSRAAYPCVQASAPIASAFVMWLIGLTGTFIFYQNMRKALYKQRYALSVLFLVMLFFSATFMLVNSSTKTSAAVPFTQEVNEPFGSPQGVFPGRVVWVWDNDATNENCTLEHNGDGVTNEDDDGWFLDKNNHQPTIDSMLSACIQNLVEEDTDSLAWDAIFRYFNNKKHNSDNGYLTGEKIFLKLNTTSTFNKGMSNFNITEDNVRTETEYYSVAETSPHVVLALLRQLVNEYGVQQEDIYVGDPTRHLYDFCYHKWHDEFPNVHYMAFEGGDGREEFQLATNVPVKYADNGSVLNITEDYFFKIVEECNYMINIPTMKAHNAGGITVFPKNHFGTQNRLWASDLHVGLVDPVNNDPLRDEYKMYRVCTDYMGHDLLGGNTVLFLLDALYSGSDAVKPPTKWDMPPFNGDWTSSIFASLDMVAIESVAYDFLRTEYDGTNGKVDYPNYGAVDDYIHQAASSDWWPDGITYDPEGDGTPMPSLGVHEHWNNSVTKEYTRNLGTGEGIELVKVFMNVTDVDEDNEIIADGYKLHQNYPNPFNPTTTISYTLKAESTVKLKVYNTNGQLIQTLVNDTQPAGYNQIKFNGTDLASGVYIYRIEVTGNNRKQIYTDMGKMVLVK